MAKKSSSRKNHSLAPARPRPSNGTPSTKAADGEAENRHRTLAIACFIGFLWIMSTPKMLHKAGVIKKEPDVKESFDQFFSTHVQPLIDRGMGAFNDTNTNHATSEGQRPGYQLKKKGARAKHPIVIVPGFITSGLELWEGEECFKNNFRQRLWGSVSMAKSFFYDRECWRRHLSLDPYTGMDPENIRLRSAQGFEAADNFIATYWVWSKVIENLADVGYDGSKMVMMSYDWRLAFDSMEKRDGYFTKMKHTVEALHKTTGEKVILMSHSMGGSVVFYFLQWVVSDTRDRGGGGGNDWVEKHCHNFVNIAGTLLGVPKSVPALLSGELKDTAALFTQVDLVLEQYFGRRLRKNLWNTWGSLFGMLPKGGDAIWGTGADLVGEDVTTESFTKEFLAPIVSWNSSTPCPAIAASTETEVAISGNTGLKGLTPYDSFSIPPSKAWSMKETIDFLLQTGGGFGPKHAASGLFSFDTKKGWDRRSKQEHWHNPVARRLPKAPSFKIYCLYGVGMPTERAYNYRPSCDRSSDANGNSNGNSTYCSDEPPNSPFLIDNSVGDGSKNIHSGVRFSDGDSTVPLLSLGYMCQKWNEKGPHNPSQIKVFTREQKNVEEMNLADPGRGGPQSGHHVDILGNLRLIEDVVKIATGFEIETVDSEQVVSDIKRIVKKVDSHPRGGLKNAILN